MLVAENLNQAVVELVTGEDDASAALMIVQNMAFAPVAICSIDAVKVSDSGDPSIKSEKARAIWMVEFGAAGRSYPG